MKITYRPEIDGLRAIAVGAVILYHAQISILGHQLFKGGFIGVDIFFVISGYLITFIILKELSTTGYFSFKNFYERRIRRILPVLLFVILASLPFAWMYLLPSSFVDFSKSILYSLGFSSNFYFHYSGQIYGATSGLVKPFLHTWSLSVEEQFYILFPGVLLISFKYFRKYLIHILFFGFFVSLGVSEWTSRNYSSASFYFIHTRIWELLAGSILAYFEITLGRRGENKTLKFILPSVGIFLIGFYIIFFNHELTHPSFLTLFPIIGVCLVIWFSNKNELVTKIISTKLFVGVGLISYSLYLWHYPIFAFTRYINFTEGHIVKDLLLILLMIILSIISFFFIERPFRNKKYKLKIIFSILTLLFLTIFVFNINVINKNGFKKRVELFENLRNPTRSCWKFEENLKTRKEVILLGNSHAASISSDLNKRLKNKGISYACFRTNYFPGLTSVNRKSYKIYNTEMLNKNDLIKNYITKNEKLTIIFFSRITHYILDGHLFDNKEGGIEKENNSKIIDEMIVPNDIQKIDKLERENILLNNILNELNYIKNLGHNLIIVYPYPEVGFHVPKQFITNKNKKDLPILSTSYDVYKERNQLLIKTFDKIIGKNIYKVYPDKSLCNKVLENRCVVNSKNELYYYDDDHPSLKGAEIINNLIMRELKKIEFK